MISRFLNLMCMISLALQASLPAGYMVAPADDGTSMTIVVCTGYGPLVITLDADGNQLPAGQENPDAKPCDYATVGTAALMGNEPHRLSTEATYAAVTYRIIRNLFRATPKPGAVSARGPPLA